MADGVDDHSDIEWSNNEDVLYISDSEEETNSMVFVADKWILALLILKRLRSLIWNYFMRKMLGAIRVQR